MINEIVNLCSAKMQTFINAVSHIECFFYHPRMSWRVLIRRVEWNKAVHDSQAGPVRPQWSRHPRFSFSTNEGNIDIFRRKKIRLHICEDGCSADFWKIFHWLSKVATADEFCMAGLKFSARPCSIRHLADWHVSHINPTSDTHRRNSSRSVIVDLWRHLKQREILRSVY